MASLLTLIPQGSIGGIDIQATLEEVHSTTLQVTEHPVEFGAAITDHSFSKPVQLTMHCGWSNSSAEALIGEISALFLGGFASLSDYVTSIYTQLLGLQQSRTLMFVTTSILAYDNMLITSLQLTRDEKTSQALMVTATMQSVIVVDTQSATLPPIGNQANPASTAESISNGPRALTEGNPSNGGAVPAWQWVPSPDGP